jgi:cysteine synthase
MRVTRPVRRGRRGSVLVRPGVPTVGPSSGAALAAVAQKIPELPDHTRILTFCYDTGERYLSVDGLFT